MGVEMPFITAVLARLENPEISLATHGGIVFPLALIIEAPVIMLLSASTALSKDWESCQKIRRFMMILGASLTFLHLMVVLTPLYDLVVVKLLGAPEEIIESARIGLAYMLPWTWSIAYRRFQQGVMIRFGHSKAVGVGTMVRLATDVVVLGSGLMIGSFPGYIIGPATQGLSTLAEAIYSGLSVLQSWYQGTLLYSRNTSGIPESMAFFLVTVMIVLSFGVLSGKFTGLFVGLFGFSLANLTQTIWLWIRSRKIMREVGTRDVDAGWSVS